MQLLQAIDQRLSIRAYRTAPVERSKIEAIINAARLAPSAGDLQAYLILIVESPETKERLSEAALGQDFIAKAPLVLVFLADTRRSEKTYGLRGATLFSVQDATIAPPTPSCPPQCKASVLAGLGRSTSNALPSFSKCPLTSGQSS